MRTQKEIRERLNLLEDKYSTRENILPYWNNREFETAIWYLKWVLEESDSKKQTDKCESCIHNAERKDMIKQGMIGIPYCCLHCTQNIPIYVPPSKRNLFNESEE